MMLQQTVLKGELSLCSIKLLSSVEVLERWKKTTDPNKCFQKAAVVNEFLSDHQVGHWQDMQSGLKGGTVDKELLDFEAGLEQEAGARFDKLLPALFCYRDQ